MPVFIIGDVHGYLDKLTRLLRDAGLAGPGGEWTGADATLWLLGDFVDRGPDSIGVLDAVMRLQEQAPAAGGTVRALLGNHDFLIVAAYRFPGHATAYQGRTLLNDWRDNGGHDPDLAALTPRHVAWITALPAMGHTGNTLLAHADAWFYTGYGHGVEPVNRAIRTLLAGDDPAAWERLLVQFDEQKAFADGRPDGRQRLGEFLRLFGGVRLVHGHTPIGKVTGQPVQSISAPLVYAGGQAIDVDGGMGHGGAGFVYRLE